MPIVDSGKMKQYHPILSALCLVKSVYPAPGRKCSLSSASLYHTAQKKGSNPYTAGGIVGSSYVPENEEGPEMEIWKRIFFWYAFQVLANRFSGYLNQCTLPRLPRYSLKKQFLEVEKQHHKMKLPRNDPLMVGTSDSWLSMDDVERVNHISTQGKVPPFAYNRLHTNTPWYTKSFPNANIYFPHACILYMSCLYHLFSKDIAAPQEFFIGARTEPRRIIN